MMLKLEQVDNTAKFSGPREVEHLQKLGWLLLFRKRKCLGSFHKLEA